MKSGISTSTGQPTVQGRFLHCKQRFASSIATSGEYPNGTSLKFLIRFFGSCSGIGCFSFLTAILDFHPCNFTSMFFFFQKSAISEH